MTELPTDNPLRPGQWSAMPKLVRDTGALTHLTVAAARCFIGLVAEADWPHGGTVSKVSQADLARITGQTSRAIRKGLKQLEALGLVARLHHGGGREGDAAVYVVLTPQTTPSEIRNARSASDQERPFPGSGTPVPQNRNARSPEQEPPFLPLRREEGRTAEAAVHADLDPRILDALTNQGIGEPLRSRLAALPGLTVRMIGEEADKVACRPLILNKPVIIATNLQSRIRQEQLQNEARLAAETKRQQDREREQRAAQVAEDQDERNRAAIEAMDQDELVARVEAVLAKDAINHHRWARAVDQDGVRQAIATNRVFRAAVLRAREALVR